MDNGVSSPAISKAVCVDIVETKGTLTFNNVLSSFSLAQSNRVKVPGATVTNVSTVQRYLKKTCFNVYFKRTIHSWFNLTTKGGKTTSNLL